MLRRYKPLMIQKVVASAATPEFLAPNDGTRLYGILFIAEKAVGSENTADIIIQINGQDALVLRPGGQLSWPQPPYEAGFFLPEDFIIKAGADGDGIRAIANVLMGA
jgi:hypothetical protein